MADPVVPPPVATPPVTPPAVTPPVTPPAAPDWKASFNADLKGYVDTKGFQSPEAVADAYRSLEKLQGVPQDRILKLPDKFYDDQGKLTPEGRSIYSKLGAPAEAKEYNLPMPEKGGDAKLLEHFKNVFHEAGVPKNVAEKIVASWNGYQDAQTKAFQEQMATKFAAEDGTLKKDWGAAFDQNVNVAKEAVRTMGWTKEQIDGISAVLGHAEAMKMFHKLGREVGEAPFIGGQSTGARVLEPATAMSQIKELMRDTDFQKKLSSGDRESLAKWTRLHEMAVPGTMTLGQAQ